MKLLQFSNHDEQHSLGNFLDSRVDCRVVYSFSILAVSSLSCLGLSVSFLG